MNTLREIRRLGVALASIAALAGAAHAGPVRLERTFQNGSLQAADGFQMTANPNTNMIYEARGQSTPNISPRTTYFPTTSFGANGLNTIDVALNPTVNGDTGTGGAKLYVTYLGDQAGINQAQTNFRNDGAQLPNIQYVSLEPTINYLGGNQYQVVFANNNSQAVDVSSLAIGYDDPGNPLDLNNYTPGGTLLALTPPTSPLPIGRTLTYDVTVTNPSLAVWASDTVSLSSQPSNLFFDLTAIPGVPEPSSLALLGLGVLGLFGYCRWQRRKPVAV